MCNMSDRTWNSRPLGGCHGHWTADDMQVLERVLQQAVKMISGLKGHTYKEKCKEIGLETLENRREDIDMIQNHCESGQCG